MPCHQWVLGLALWVSAVPVELNAKAHRPLVLSLPDQTVIELQAEPVLEQKKLSRLTLLFSQPSLWQPIGFDAIMPTHNHGMIVKPTPPSSLAEEPLRYQIRGIKLHMPGPWQLKLKLKHQKTGQELWLSHAVQVPF